MPAWPVDGMDVLAVETATKKAVTAVRSGGGPHFLEYRTYRFRAHSMFDPELYREKQEIEEWKKRDPIVTFTNLVKTQELVGAEDLSRFEKEIAEEIAKSVAFADAGKWEAIEELTRFVYSEERGDHG
jgi:TPP-dependent pyruvate/acetoin dehydrogenase alpha subunit